MNNILWCMWTIRWSEKNNILLLLQLWWWFYHKQVQLQKPETTERHKMKNQSESAAKEEEEEYFCSASPPGGKSAENPDRCTFPQSRLLELLADAILDFFLLSFSFSPAFTTSFSSRLHSGQYLFDWPHTVLTMSNISYYTHTNTYTNSAILITCDHCRAANPSLDLSVAKSDFARSN